MCKKDYYTNDSVFNILKKPIFKKNVTYQIDKIYHDNGLIGISGTCGTMGVSGTMGTSGTMCSSGGTFTTTTTTTTSTTTTTAPPSTTTTIYPSLDYCVINGIYFSKHELEKYFYSKREERKIKLEKLKKVSEKQI